MQEDTRDKRVTGDLSMVEVTKWLVIVNYVKLTQSKHDLTIDSVNKKIWPWTTRNYKKPLSFLW